MPDREERFCALLDAVGAVTDGAPPRVLDLAGGTGTITLRTLARFPGAQVTVLDQDPVLMAIAAASLRDRGTVVDADLGDAGWRAKLPGDGFDAVLTATALHWLPAERVAALGVPAFACTPDAFPDLMAAAIERRDLQAFAERFADRQKGGGGL